MALKCGIVGLPNVGKSTLFNALTQSQKAEAANYPFCTIDANSAQVSVPDERLKILAKLAGSEKIIPSYIDFVDIAGLVEGASQGAGLGNKFLSHIREVDAILHVVRCFEDKDVVHVRGGVNPLDDIELIETELILADLDSVTKRLTNLKKKSKDPEAQATIALLEAALKHLENGEPASLIINSENATAVKGLQLLTTKPLLYICNVAEDELPSGNQLSSDVQASVKQRGYDSCCISAKIEAEIAQLTDEKEKEEFLGMIGLKESGIGSIMKACYELLGLASYFTIGPKEARSWTFKKGILAPQAAGIIHTDFEKGFISAEVISYLDYLEHKTESRIKELGKMKLQGREYEVQDGDVVHFRFNV